MDLNDLSESTAEDEKCNKSNSNIIQKSESDNEGIYFITSIDKDWTQSADQYLEKYDEIEHNAEATKGARSKVQSICPKIKGNRSSTGAICKGLERNISLMTDSENLKTSQSMLSFTSTGATCDSNSSKSVSSDDEIFMDLKEISDRCESDDVSDLEQPTLGLTRINLENLSNYPSTTSFSDIGLSNESHTKDCAFIGAAESSLEEDSNSLKSPDISKNINAVDLPPLPKGWLLNCFKSDEILPKNCFSSTLAPDKSSNIEELPSNKDKTTVSPFEKSPSCNIRQKETSEISELGAVGGYDYDCSQQDYSQKEDKSVRRKVITSSKTKVLPTSSSSPSVSDASRRIGRSLLHISKSIEQTTEQDDQDTYETYGRSGEVKYFAPQPWVKELLSACYQTVNADDTPLLDTESLLKEVQRFFQNHRINVDENLSWRERKMRIVTSKYFSDEFSRRHGLLSSEEIFRESLKDLERFSSPHLEKELTMLELCRTLIERDVSENDFIFYIKNRIHTVDYDMECLFESSDQERCHDDVKTQLYSIDCVFGFDAMLELYEKLMRERATFLSILFQSKKPSAAENRSQGRELLYISEDSSYIPDYFSAGNQSLIYSDDLSKNVWDITNFRNEGNVSINDAIDDSETSQMDSRESEEASNVVSESDSNVLNSFKSAENEPCNKKTSL